MNKALRILIIALLCVAPALYGVPRPDYKSETVSYKVMYKWGLITKQAGRATISIREDGDKYQLKLVARSEPWADKFFCVRDTLLGTARLSDFKPLVYEKISHEGSEHKHDVVKFAYSGNRVTGYCTRRVVKDGELKKDECRELEAVGATVDMLTSFYYMRSLPFETWKPGSRYTLNIFSGKRKELLTFSYLGKQKVKSGGKTYECYHIRFIFTGDGGKKTSDDMDAWLTADDLRLPVQLEGKLPVGKVRCELM